MKRCRLGLVRSRPGTRTPSRADDPARTRENCVAPRWHPPCTILRRSFDKAEACHDLSALPRSRGAGRSVSPVWRGRRDLPDRAREDAEDTRPPFVRSHGAPGAGRRVGRRLRPCLPRPRRGAVRDPDREHALGTPDARRLLLLGQGQGAPLRLRPSRPGGRSVRVSRHGRRTGPRVREGDGLLHPAGDRAQLAATAPRRRRAPRTLRPPPGLRDRVGLDADRHGRRAPLSVESHVVAGDPLLVPRAHLGLRQALRRRLDPHDAQPGPLLPGVRHPPPRLHGGARALRQSPLRVRRGRPAAHASVRRGDPPDGPDAGAVLVLVRGAEAPLLLGAHDVRPCALSFDRDGAPAPQSDGRERAAAPGDARPRLAVGARPKRAVRLRHRAARRSARPHGRRPGPRERDRHGRRALDVPGDGRRHRVVKSTGFAAHYLDGQTPVRRRAWVRVAATGLEIAVEGGATLWWPLGSIRQTQGIYAGEPIRLELGGTTPAALVVDDPALLAALRAVGEAGRRFHGPRRPRLRVLVTTLAALGVVATGGALYVWGIPAASSVVASILPVS